MNPNHAPDLDWLEQISAVRRAADPEAYAAAEALAKGNGDGYVVQVPVEHQDGTIGWRVVAAGGDDAA